MSTIKRKMKLSGNVAFPTMLQSVLCLVFLFSVKVFFGQNIQNSGQNYPRGRGGGSWWWSVCHSSIQFSFKIKNWKLMSIFDYRYFLSRKIRKCQIENFGLFFLVIEYWNITYMFTLILSTMRRKMKLSGDVAFPTMLQSVLCLVFLFSVKVFFGQNIQNRGQNYPRGRGGGSWWWSVCHSWHGLVFLFSAEV